MPGGDQELAFAFRRGERLDGRYEVVQPVGRGGMARVYQAQDLSSGEHVAIKVLRPELAMAPGAVARLEQEAAILQRLAHPSIVAFRATGRLPSGGLYLVMEFLEGHTLGQWMRRRKRMQPGELASTLASVCAGLHAAHREGIVHRDLKPDNIFLCALDGQVKLLDFGVSKLFGGSALTRPGELLGTPRYMAPEQLRPEAPVTYRADLYALGVIVYEALAGQPPFKGANSALLLFDVLAGAAVPLSSVRSDLPAQLCAAIMRALSNRPEERFGTAIEMGDSLLASLGAGQSVRAVTEPLGLWPTPSPGVVSPAPEVTRSQRPQFRVGSGASRVLPAEPPAWMSDSPCVASPEPEPPWSTPGSFGESDNSVHLPPGSFGRFRLAWVATVVGILTAVALGWWALSGS